MTQTGLDGHLKDHITRPVVLVGMMGAGKSVLGKMLAEHAGLPFFDSDSTIVEKAGLSIPEIFDRLGEPAFRRMEKDVLTNLVRQGACVIATGGGAVMDPDTRRLFKDKTTTLWLDVACDVLWHRLKNGKNRPVLQTEHPETLLKKLLEERAPFYAQAEHRVTIGTESPQACLEKMIRALSLPEKISRIQPV